MSSEHIPRRAFLKSAAASATGATTAALGLSGTRSAAALGLTGTASAAARPTAAAGQAEPLKLGVASYSLREFPRARAIAMTKALGAPYINIKSFHLEYDLSDAELAAGRREFEAGGLEIVGGGTITFAEDTDEEVGHYFNYAKAAGMPLMVSTCDPKILPRIERFVKQHDIKIAIHNHGPEDEFYPSPYDALKYLEDMDPRMGLCIDIGHTVRTGTDIVQSIADAGPRLLDMHVKDLRDLSVKESQCIVGEGAMPMAAIFEQLLAMDYQGCANLEYEIDADDPLPGMKQSFAYMRGVLAGIVGSNLRDADA